MYIYILTSIVRLKNLLSLRVKAHDEPITLNVGGKQLEERNDVSEIL